MTSTWRIWVDATTPQKATSRGKRLLAAIGVTAVEMAVSRYEKTGGHVVDFRFGIAGEGWAEAVLELLRFAEHAGRGWSISGPFDHEVQLLSNHASVAGVTMITCRLENLAGN